MSDSAAKWRDDHRSADGSYDAEMWGDPDELKATIAVRELVALQLENKRIRAAVEHVIADSPGTPNSVKSYLRKVLDGDA